MQPITAEQLERYLRAMNKPGWESRLGELIAQDVENEVVNSALRVHNKLANVILETLVDQTRFLPKAKLMLSFCPAEIFLSFFVIAFEAGIAAAREMEVDVKKMERKVLVIADFCVGSAESTIEKDEKVKSIIHSTAVLAATMMANELNQKD